MKKKKLPKEDQSNSMVKNKKVKICEQWMLVQQRLEIVQRW